MNTLPFVEWEEEPPDPAWWDGWYALAVAAGVRRDVAEAGRTLVRASYEDEGPDDRWDSDVAEMSGINDDGLAMIRFGLLRPRTALRVWRRIAETMGLRGVRMNGRLVPWDEARRSRETQALLAELARPEAPD